MKSSQKDILFLCQFFYPEYISSAMLPFDTAKYLASLGYTIGSLVGYPKEYSKNQHCPIREQVDGVEIRRIRYLHFSRVGKASRLINYFSFTFHAWLHIREIRNYKTVMVYSDPPILPVAALRAKRKFGTKIIFVVYDVYPEVAYASCALHSKSIISKVMNLINRKLYSVADYVIAISEEMKEYLLERRPELSPERIITIYNWAIEKEKKPDSDEYRQFGYREGQFIVSYLGNLGTCQDIETILEAAEILKDDERVRFLIAGHGNKKDLVTKRISEIGLQNIQILNFLTGESFQQVGAISSSCIVSLEKGLQGTCATSKYYQYLQNGKPVLVIMDKTSYVAKEVEKEKIGYSIKNGDSRGLKNAILAMAENPDECKAMGVRAKELYIAKYSYESAMGKYKQLVKKVLEQETCSSMV